MIRVLSLCDVSGVMVAPWLRAGCEATIVDLQHPSGTSVDGPLTKVGVDLMEYEPDGQYDIVFAFPPCTHLASSGARWFKDKGLKALIDGLTLVERCREICEAQSAPWMIENPVGTLSTYWRKPDFRFDPCDFGGYVEGGVDRYTKRTCLWVGDGFVFPELRRVEPTEGSKMHLLSPSARRADLRSVTPTGFAEAVFVANCALVAP